MNMLNTAFLASSFIMATGEAKDKSKKHNLPNFKGILEVKHFIPGRIRLSCPIIKGNKDIEFALIDTISKISVINEVKVNLNIGSILITYNKNAVEPVLVVGVVLKILGLEEEVQKATSSLVDKEGRNILESINRTIYEKTNGVLDLKSSVMLLLGGYAMYDINKRPDVMPGGYTALWWLYSTLIKKI